MRPTISKTRAVLLAGLMAAMLLLVSEDGRGQGFRGGPPDPNRMFDDLAKQSGGTETIDFGKLPKETKDKMNKFRSFSGAAPYPDTGTMSRGQYTEDFNKGMEAMKAKGFGGGRSGSDSRGGSPGSISGSTPGASGTGSTDWIEGRFRDSDKNKDGVITMDEASDRLKPTFSQADANGDGRITIDEYKIYVTARMSSGGGPPGQPTTATFAPVPGTDPNAGGTSSRGRNRDDDEPNARVSVSRYGKLPKEVPSWFEELDTDHDGMVGLYEWRRDKRATKEFVEQDLNGDGYLTADEWIRHKKHQLERKDETASAPERPASTARDAKGGKDRPTSGKDDKSGKNPFRN